MESKWSERVVLQCKALNRGILLLMGLIPIGILHSSKSLLNESKQLY